MRTVTEFNISVIVMTKMIICKFLPIVLHRIRDISAAGWCFSPSDFSFTYDWANFQGLVFTIVPSTEGYRPISQKRDLYKFYFKRKNL